MSGSALLPWGMLVTAPAALETPRYPQAPHPALSHPGPCPLSPPRPQLLRGQGTGKDPTHPSYKVKLHLLRAWPWPGLDVATSPAGLPSQDFSGVLLQEGCCNRGVHCFLHCEMGSQARPAGWLSQFGGHGGGLGLPELVLGIAETLRHEVDRLISLVLVGLHSRCVGVEGPDLGALRQGVLAGGREWGGWGDLRAPRELEPLGLTPRWALGVDSHPPLSTGGPPEAWGQCEWDGAGTRFLGPPKRAAPASWEARIQKARPRSPSPWGPGLQPLPGGGGGERLTRSSP